MGYNINFVDIGGGLGVDYDGTRSATSNSMNYSIQEYVNDAVSSIVDACEKNELPQPNIITESGRSLTAIIRYWFLKPWPVPVFRLSMKMKIWQKMLTSW